MRGESIPPLRSRPCKKFIRFGWTPRTGRILRNSRWWMVRDVIKERIYHRPRRFNLVTSCKERGVAEHYIEKKRLIRRRRVATECDIVGKVHVHGRDLEFRSQLVRGSRCLDVE